MFWLFGHPEVYILILPAMGIVSEVLPTFSRKPLFGYPFVVFSGIAIGFMSWGVWVHHMYTTGLGTVANAAFGISTILIAVPTGVKIFNWMATMWGGSIQPQDADDVRDRLHRDVHDRRPDAASRTRWCRRTTSSRTRTTSSRTSTRCCSAARSSRLFAGIYYWFPKFTGRMLNEKLGQVHFWLMFIGFNLTFLPMHILRAARHAAAHLHVLRGPGLGPLERACRRSARS